jgi:hypothetical protein
MDPWKVFREAQKGLPQLKWALAVAGVMALIAIVTVGWRVDPKIAVSGTIVMIVLMTLLVIFARLTATGAVHFGTPVIVLMWGSLGLTLASAFLLFTSVFFDWPLNFEPGPVRQGIEYSSSEGDETVWRVQEEINALRGTWETVNQYGDNIRQEVLERSIALADEMRAIDEATLGESGRIIKFEYACYALIMKSPCRLVMRLSRESKRSREYGRHQRTSDMCAPGLPRKTKKRSAAICWPWLTALIEPGTTTATRPPSSRTSSIRYRVRT